MKANDILIVSSSVDVPTWGPVLEHIHESGHGATIFEADKVASGTVDFSTQLSNAHGLIVIYDGFEIPLEDIGSAWYRRTNFISDDSADATRQLGLDTERKVLQAAIWSEIADDRWLNPPDKMLVASRKITQLQLARKLGFSIPDTVVSNSWETINDELPETIIFKPSYSLLYGSYEVLSIYTTPFQNDSEQLPVHANPFPGIWQDRIKKDREWRITVVNDDVFEAAIYTADCAKDDWRRHQSTLGLVDFRNERFPDDEKEKCIEYLGELGLRFGAFDFIENEDDGIVFLECNPNGQFGWLEAMLDLPISASIASSLIKLARS